MTPSEFTALQKDWRIRWAAVDQWLARLPARADTLQSWYSEVFRDLDLRDCTTATYAVMVGDLEGPQSFSLLPAWYRKQAQRIRWERKERESRARADHEQREKSRLPGSCRKALAKAEAIKREEMAAGASREDAYAILHSTRAHEWEAELT